jgi:hypothetical protein
MILLCYLLRVETVRTKTKLERIPWPTENRTSRGDGRNEKGEAYYDSWPLLVISSSIAR